MPEIEINIDVYCGKCGDGLCNQTTSESGSYNRPPHFSVAPCERCLGDGYAEGKEEGHSEGYDEGYDEGKADGIEEGKAECDQETPGGGDADI